MADYRLPMDADGVKYHGTVDQNEENPGQFMYGLDENGNKRIIRTDEQGNVLTRVTGSKVEEVISSDTLVPSGTRLGPIVVDMSNYKSLTLSAHNRDSTNTNKIRFTVRDCIRGVGAGGHIEVVRKSIMVAQRVVFEPYDSYTEGIEVYFYNDEEEDYTFSLYAHKLK